MARETARLTALLILLAGMMGSSAWADRGHYNGGHYNGGHYNGGHYNGGHYNGGHYHSRAHIGVVIGGGAFWPWFYPPPYYYSYPPVVAVPSSPPVYIEQPAQASSPQSPSGYWYYCSHPKGYYPYIRECPGGWQAVSPQPSPP